MQKHRQRFGLAIDLYFAFGDYRMNLFFTSTHLQDNIGSFEVMLRVDKENMKNSD